MKLMRRFDLLLQALITHLVIKALRSGLKRSHQQLRSKLFLFTIILIRLNIMISYCVISENAEVIEGKDFVLAIFASSLCEKECLC